MILRDQNINLLDAEVAECVDVRGVALQLAVEDRSIAHEAAFQGVGGEDLVDEVVLRGHEDDVGVEEPDPFGGGVEVKGFGDGGDFGPCLLGLLVSMFFCMRMLARKGVLQAQESVECRQW